jgi:calcium-dependent protein kinase
MYFKLSQFKCYLVMEYLPYPSLRKFKHLDGDKIKTIVKNLLESIQYMHSRKLCHRDLKLDNILYDEKTERIWVIDFGISKVFEERGNKKEMLTNTGTIYYKAPEIFEGGGYDESVDMWAVGVIIY